MFTRICASVQKFISTKLELLKSDFRLRITAIAVIVLPVLIALIVTVLLPLGFEKKSSAADKQSVKAHGDLYYPLKADKAFLSAQLAIAAGDSIGLILDLRDSLVKMAVKGVVIHECSLSAYTVLSGYSGMVKDEFTRLLSGKPFKLKKESATIVKLPIKIKKAPKDTIEAQAKSSDAPGPLEKNDVKILYEFADGISLEIVQNEPFTFDDLYSRVAYGMRLRISSLKDKIKYLYGNEDEIKPLVIRIHIPQNDAIAIYRATPGSLKMAFRW
ncbi:MAG: hypothetical protein JNL74_14945 [Fibrobacteres bacterium]|nr:hypothetical protein [Fibrobacterota bacterium]